MKKGTDVTIMTIVSGSKKNAWPNTSMPSRQRFGSKLLMISMRMCSLDRSVHGEHKRNIAPNRTHCSSSQAFDEVSKTFRTVALVAEMITTIRISQDKTFPIRKLTASMARLSLSKPSTCVPLDLVGGVAEPPVPPPAFGPACAAGTYEPSSTAARRSIGKTDDGSWPTRAASMPASLRLAAWHAQVTCECRALMAPVDDEIVALGLARDRLGDRGVEQIVAFGRAQRSAQIGGVFLTEAHVKGTRAGHPHPVAGLAEIVGQRRDEAQPAAGFGDLDVARRPAAAIVDILEREALG